jgi:iron complex transport system substrate-binding protein
LFNAPIAGRALACLLLLASLLAAGCGSAASPDAGTPSGAATPHRIVSLSATATESLFAIGAGRQVVAVDDQSNVPARAPHTKLSSLHPSVEAVAAYRPDLVVTTGDDATFVAGLRKLSVAVLVQPAARSLADAYGQIERLGTATGHRAAAHALVARMRRRIAALVGAARPRRRLSVYHEISPDQYSATSQTFIGSVYRLFGLRNVADAAKGAASGYPQLSREYVLRANPDLVVLADVKCCRQSAATVARRPDWSQLRAVRDRHVILVNDDVASRWGPRTVDFVAAVAAALRRVER